MVVRGESLDPFTNAVQERRRGYLAHVAAPLETHVCPHCKKPFVADLLGPESKRAGYKCPHCRLFVPISRTNDPQAA
jgi:DNA-directed RNA polymerase subunit RPC12/RpoP